MPDGTLTGNLASVSERGRPRYMPRVMAKISPEERLAAITLATHLTIKYEVFYNSGVAQW